MTLEKISPIVSDTLTRKQEWTKQDTIWMLSLYGTAIGAGILFLPINAGLGGIFPIFIMALLAFPMTYYSHQALCRFVLSGHSKNNITEVVDEHFGSVAGKIITWLYFFAIYPILLMYSVAITNTSQSFLINQLGITPPPRVVLATILIFGLMLIVRFGQQLIVRSMSVLVYPFVFSLIALALYLMPYWNTSVFYHHGVTLFSTGSSNGLLKTLWLILPVMVFSFNHSPIISSFAVSQKQYHGTDADERSSLILKYSHIMMVVTVLFFVLSCVLSLSPENLAEAKQQNISILSYLANHFHTPVIAYIAPCIAFIAISKSFFGHYLGAQEGLQGLIQKTLQSRGKTASPEKIKPLIEAFVVLTCILVATINPSILGMIEALGGPVIAVILFLMPMYAIVKVPAMQKYKHPFSNVFIIVIGLISISAIFYGLFQ